jgi:hypothetical protein
MHKSYGHCSRRSLTHAALIAAVLVLFMLLPSDLSRTASAASANEAVQWARSKIGQYLDQDGAYGYQCVDLIRYYYNYLGVSPVSGHGKDYATNSLPNGWKRYEWQVPSAGDIAIWNSSQGGGYGHVAIVISADQNSLTTIDQNWPTGSSVKEVYHKDYTGFWEFIRPAFTGAPSGSSSNSGGSISIIYACCKQNPVQTGGTTNVYAKTSDNVDKVAVINERGENTAWTTNWTSNHNGEKEWDWPWKVETIGTRNITVRAYSGSRYVDYRISLTVTGSVNNSTSSSSAQIVQNGIYIVQLTGSNLCVDVYYGNTADGTQIHAWSRNNSDAQKWRISSHGNNIYNVVSVAAGKPMEIASSNNYNGARVQVWSSNNTDTQKWSIIRNGNGTYTFLNSNSGLALDMKDGNFTEGNFFQAWQYNGTISQQFNLFKMD